MIKKIKFFLILIFFSSGLLLIGGCTGSTVGIGDPHYRQGPSKGGPPPWAPAHGHRAKYTYRYYPSFQLYHDLGRNLYFYYNAGQWKAYYHPPVRLTGYSVDLIMATDLPYHYHSDVVRQYPPGRDKSKGRGRR